MRLGSKRPRYEPPAPPRIRSDAEIEADICGAMQAAANERGFAEQCLAPRGKDDHMLAAVRWDHLAVAYRNELVAARTMRRA